MKSFLEQQYGTKAFDHEVMHELITFDKSAVEAEEWLKAVPEGYRKVCVIALKETFEEYKNRPLNKYSLKSFINRARAIVCRDLQKLRNKGVV